jgi:hypothetical protein
MTKVYITSDLALAAFLLTRGHRLIVAKKLPTGRYHFELEDNDNQCEKLKFEFVNSEFMKYDNNLKMLKKMIYS